MKWFLRCDECGAIDIQGSLRHILSYAFSSRYRRQEKEAAMYRDFMLALISAPPSCVPFFGGGTIYIPRIEGLDSRTQERDG